jgi:hypothetical protein
MKVMTPTSTNSREILGPFIESMFFNGGGLLFIALLIIFSLAGGPLPLIAITCVLILGFGLGVVLERYFPYRIFSLKTR